ncbi:MAG: hypothetical protein IT257_10550 [Chitinophagaceae bacterium]|nr:hypothetical protein [Chitinophagaceae bacterium]
MKKTILMLCCITLAAYTQAATFTLHLKCYIEGYYQAGGNMAAAAVNGGCPWATPGMTDRVQVYLRDKAAPYAIRATGLATLSTTGDATVILSHPTLTFGDYYIDVKNTRNALETCSKLPVRFNGVDPVYYDFTTASNKAYASNMKEVAPGVWAFYSGDVNGDGNIDLLDDALMENDVLTFASGCKRTDLNGDGNVDILDLVIFQSNPVGAFIYAKHPW